MSNVSKEFAQLVEDYIVSPENWPAAMAARTLRLAAGHPAYSPSNQTLILAQLVARYEGQGQDLMAALQGAVDAMHNEIAPRTVWAKRGYIATGQPLQIWSKPVPIWVDDSGQRVKPNTPGAIKRSVFRVENTYIAADVMNSDGESAEVADSAPALSEGDSLVAWERLVAWITAQGWSVARTSKDMREGGWTMHSTRSIAVHGGLDGWAAVETLAHEIAHALLHDADDGRNYHEHRGAMEAEAESVAFGVMMLAGQRDLAKGSVRYITDWAARDKEVIAVAYERACHVTDALAQVMMGESDVTVTQSAKVAKLQAKADNKQLAAQLREMGIAPRGEAWARAKAGVPLAALASEFAKAA